MKLGEFIRSNREKLKLSVRELGKLVDVSGPYISMIETNKINTIPSEDVIKKISISLELSQEENNIFYKLYEECMQEKVNKKIFSLKNNVINMKNVDNYGLIIEKNNGDIKYKESTSENKNLINLEEFSEEDKKAIRDFVEYLRFKKK